MVLTEEDRMKWAGYTKECHPDVFNKPRETIDYSKPGCLTEEQIKTYYEDGYLLVENYIETELLDAVRDEIVGMVDVLAEDMHRDGVIKNTHSDKGYLDRLNYLQEEYPGANIVLAKRGRTPKSVQNLWSNERILNIMEQLIGPDIAGHPVWNLRTKTPHDEATTVPWHQDVAYLHPDSYKVLQVTAWVPLVDTNVTNGCLQMVKGGHKLGRVAMHQCCAGTTHYVMVDEEEMQETLDVKFPEDVITIPVSYGSMLLFNNMIPHRSLDNKSDMTRWSLDLRWQDANKPVGFPEIPHGGIVMRKAGEPDFKPDWEKWLGPVKPLPSDISKRYDPVIAGEWMRRWEITNMNVHSGRFGELAAKTKGGVLTWHAGEDSS